MNVYSISTQAFQKIDGVLLKSMLQLVRKQLNAVWNIEDLAKIVLVDVEEPEGKVFWQSQVEHPDILMIAYAKQNICEARWFLQKPIRVQPLVSLLNAIAAQMTTQALQTPSSVTAPESHNTSLVEIPAPTFEETEPPSPPTDHLFEPSKYLLGLLQNAMYTGQPKRFSCAGLPPLYVLPSERRCFTSAINMRQIDSSQKILYGAFAEHVESVNLSIGELKSEVEKNNTLRSYPIETMLWLTTLYASHGRLIATQTHKRFVQLKQWPNFIILPHYPMHINLAAFMLKHAADLKTIAAKTKVLLPTVIDFFNACYVIGLIIEEENFESREDNRLPDQKNKLLKGILKRLLQLKNEE